MTNKYRIGALAALPLAMLASVGVAQDNSRDYGRPLDTPEIRADMALRGAAACANGRVPNSVRKVLATPVASKEEAKRVKGLVGVARECFQVGWPEFQPTTFRNALAESIYRTDHRLRDPAPPGPRGALPASFGVVPAGQSGSPAQEAAWQLAAIAKCMVFIGPYDARQFVLGPRNVAEEQRRFGLLRASMEQCVGGESLALLTARNLRGFVASALLERATVTVR